MPVPYLASALNGWTTPIVFQVITKTTVNFQTVETSSPITLDCNLQPMPKQDLAQKPTEQRSWKWWSLIVREGNLLEPDDVLTDPSGIRYRIMSVSNWGESGFQKYEAIEDYGT